MAALGRTYSAAAVWPSSAERVRSESSTRATVGRHRMTAAGAAPGSFLARPVGEGPLGAIHRKGRQQCLDEGATDELDGTVQNRTWRTVVSSADHQRQTSDSPGEAVYRHSSKDTGQRVRRSKAHAPTHDSAQTWCTAPRGRPTLAMTHRHRRSRLHADLWRSGSTTIGSDCGARAG